jgi:hypothetical protein
MSDEDLIVVTTFSTPQEADLAKSALEAAGIEALIRTDSGGGMRPSLAWAGGVQVIVRSEDALAARDILDIPAKTPRPTA